MSTISGANSAALQQLQEATARLIQSKAIEAAAAKAHTSQSTPVTSDPDGDSEGGIDVTA